MSKRSLISCAAASALGLSAASQALAGIPLGPGSIAFTGFNADGGDNLAFVALQDLPVGTVIGFTDNEWNGTGWTDTNENGFELTLTSPVTAGTIVQLNGLGGSLPFAGTSAFGTLALTAGAGTNLGIGNSDEAIYAYVGSFASPTAFLALIANDSSAALGALAVPVSLAGTGLVEGQTALFITGDEDIAAYTGLRNDQASFAAYLPQINTLANWISQDASGDQSIDGISPDVPFSNEAFTLVPAPGAAALLGLGGLVIARRRR